MENLTVRQKEILAHIVRSYLATMQPVGSRTLTAKGDLQVSAATIRNEMYDLEEMGFITHPHVSAGRIPTDKGYRYYVDHLLEGAELEPELARKIRREIEDKIESIENLIEKTSRIISMISQEACIAVLSRPSFFLFKQLHLVALDARRILVIWITTDGSLQSNIVDLKEDISPECLQQIGTFLNSELAGYPLEQLETIIMRKLAETRDSLYSLYTWASTIVRESLAKQKREETVFLGGWNYLLDKPEFRDIEKTKRLFELLEDKAELLAVVRANTNDTPITISIGKEIRCHDLWECSLISAGYALRESRIGSINILGPKRIPYSRSISLLRYMSDLITLTINKMNA